MLCDEDEDEGAAAEPQPLAPTYLVCFLMVEKIWRSTPGFSAAAEATLRQPWFGCDLSALGFARAQRLGSAYEVLGVEAGDFQVLRTHLEQQLGVSLPDVAPVACQAPSDVRRTMPSLEAYVQIAAALAAQNRKAQREQKRSIMFHAASQELARAYLCAQQRRKFLALDVEAYEFNHSIILEIGYTVATWRGSSFALRDHHFVVAESVHVLNGVKVANAKFAFNFGTSAVLPLHKAMARLRAVLRSAEFIVGHAIASDEKFLRRFGVDFGEQRVFDTQVLVRAMAGATDLWRLSRILDYCEIGDYCNLHNAGNDAHYTMAAFLSLALRGGRDGDGRSPVSRVLRTRLENGSYLMTPVVSGVSA